MSYILPDLPYDYRDLEPYFDERTMKIHHQKHHQTYIDNTNNILKNLTRLSNLDLEDLIKSLDQVESPDTHNLLRNNAGGHINHSIFWNCLKIGTEPHGELKSAIESNFGRLEKFKEHFETVAINRFGSGWAWLILKNNKILEVVSTANQDNPLMGESISGVSGYPIFGLDVWEHAYYLKYENRRYEYIKAFWSVINWDEANKRFIDKI